MIDTLFAEPNPGPVKAVLATLGHSGPTVRAPMTAASDLAAWAAREAYAQAG